VDWGPLITVLGRATVSAEVEKCIAELKDLAGTQPTAPAVAQYVVESFEATRA